MCQIQIRHKETCANASVAHIVKYTSSCMICQKKPKRNKHNISHSDIQNTRHDYVVSLKSVLKHEYICIT